MNRGSGIAFVASIFVLLWSPWVHSNPQAAQGTSIFLPSRTVQTETNGNHPVNEANISVGSQTQIVLSQELADTIRNGGMLVIFPENQERSCDQNISCPHGQAPDCTNQNGFCNCVCPEGGGGGGGGRPPGSILLYP